ncbi:RNA 2',3'-cyclic phosphodiesterase [Phenylobacterium sp.]|uniref:RNA 2',3'-cyclic phosphodiesterase n=1 Tax=Phenylobacterium sp. TaxID=1871053 RepID=UPI0035AE718D
MIRLFAAIAIPEELGTTLLPRQDRLPGARWRPLEALHITLRFIGDVPENLAGDLDAELTTIGGGPLELSLTGVGAFGEGADIHAVWAGVEENEGLKRLARACEIAARRAGVKAETRAYKPHVTLAYLRRPNPAEVAAWIQENNLLRTEPFRITSFGLYSSWQSDQGSWYRLEREYPLY